MDLIPDIFFGLSAPLIGALIALGMTGGLLAGLLGVGGGFVLVPGLFFILQSAGFDETHLMHLCIGTSLSIIVFTGLSSARAHWKKDALSFEHIRSIGPGILLGTILGSMLASLLTSDTLSLFFASLLIILTSFMATDLKSLKFSAKTATNRPANILAGLFIGSISTMMGIGGATLSVPYMRAINLEMRRAIGTASALGTIISIPATLGFIIIGQGIEGRPPLSLGYVNIAITVVIIPFSMLCAPLGAKLTHSLPTKTLRRIFALFMIVVAARLWSQIIL